MKKFMGEDFLLQNETAVNYINNLFFPKLLS